MESRVPRSKPFRSLTGADLLKRYFSDARRNATNKHYGVFLDLFSGDGGIGHYLQKLGFPVISVDISKDPRLDLLTPEFFRLSVVGSRVGVFLGFGLVPRAQLGVGPGMAGWVFLGSTLQ